MMMNTTLDHLRTLKLDGMADCAATATGHASHDHIELRGTYNALGRARNSRS